ncbi:uncharacterized protein LOC127288689 [Leptopilina boulardi]|uniref:uncharacterized protein LOC127288689 n=1 Tax=Leptopilina boulardi TaxID=63433 RepID=UPI0021F561AB|nr:uncharacterized protein LOC127288689 [Leptopilina boulardi]
MLKIFCILLVISIIFEDQSVYSLKPKDTKKKKYELIPGVFHSKLTNYKIESNNNIIEDKGNGLIQWKSEVKQGNDIGIYADFGGEPSEIEDLCDSKAQTIFPKMIKQFLGIEFCPINKDTLSLITNDYSRPAKILKNSCEKPKDYTLKLISKKENKLIMTLNVKTEDIRLEPCE